MAWVTIKQRVKELKADKIRYQLNALVLGRNRRKLDRRKSYEQSLIQLNEKKALEPIKLGYNDKVNELNKNKQILSEYLAAVKKLAYNATEAFVPTGDNQQMYAMATKGDYYMQDISNGTAYLAVPISEASDVSSDDNYVKDSNNNPKQYKLVMDLKTINTSLLERFGLNADFSDVNKDTISSLETTVSSAQSQLQLEIQQAYTDYNEQVSAEKEIYENEQEMMEEEIADEETDMDLEQQDTQTILQNIDAEIEQLENTASQQAKNEAIKIT